MTKNLGSIQKYSSLNKVPKMRKAGRKHSIHQHEEEAQECEQKEDHPAGTEFGAVEGTGQNLPMTTNSPFGFYLAYSCVIVLFFVSQVFKVFMFIISFIPRL